MKRITNTNCKKFTDHVESELLSIGFKKDNDSFFYKGITAKIDCYDSVIYSLFLRFPRDFPKFAHNQFSGKHNFHSGSSIRMSIVEFNIYFEDVKNYVKGEK